MHKHRYTDTCVHEHTRTQAQSVEAWRLGAVMLCMFAIVGSGASLPTDAHTVWLGRCSFHLTFTVTPLAA